MVRTTFGAGAIFLSFAFMLYAAAFANTADCHLSGISRLIAMLQVTWNVLLTSIILMISGTLLLPIGVKFRIFFACLYIFAFPLLFDLWPNVPAENL